LSVAINQIDAQDAPVAQSVVVTGLELVHTTQLLPLDQHGELFGRGDPDRQVQRVLDVVVDVLAAQQAQAADVVKLNVYLADESAKSEEIDKVVGLELGDDDYDTKPF
jgi:enamine deaminase RidA (YjgF/YER057c/UK114 family)